MPSLDKTAGPLAFLGVLACCACVVASLTVRPSKFRWLLFFPMLSIPLKLVHLHFGPKFLDFWLHCFLPVLFLMSLDWMIFHEPQLALRQKTQKGNIKDKPLHERLAWGFRLFLSIRGVGWPSQLLSLPAGFLTLDLASVLHRTAKMPSSGSPIVQQALMTLSYGMTIIGGFQIQHYIFSILLVSVGYSKPQDFVPLFGVKQSLTHAFSYWSKAYSLRKFWSEVWHQTFRRCFSAPGIGLVRVLRIPRGTNASAYTQLYSAFILSGLLHVSADYAVADKWVRNSMVFFILQAVGITLEDVVTHYLWKIELSSRWKGGAQRLGWMMGYIWVSLWFIYTLPFWQQDDHLEVAIPESSSLIGKALTYVSTR
ncbi:hypothetical protein CYLTODRAFT_443134 [Cylindrobasidium torrendii FP15055 ss-10]|uniref:Wax synthase domain-containing protein n=1 Tax=Cylindrobasidium torrendii FP15055 ss-10 TaxID=1314674 RepID=A0A0D7BE30_9AGAR|nr:hypothetical protein CYLTODRAFT_443134 [Cylindrobasidium torrendii FP15055 ss-10]